MGPSKVIRPIDFRLTGPGPSTLVSGPSTLAVYSHGGVGFGRLESNTAETSHRRTRQLLGKAHTAPSVFFFFYHLDRVHTGTLLTLRRDGASWGRFTATNPTTSVRGKD